MLDMRAVEPHRFPNITERVGPGRARLAARPHTRGAGCALHDRRDRRRQRGTLQPARALRRRASAPAPACTAQTVSRRTRSRSASCSGGGRRSPQPPSRLRRPLDPRLSPPPHRRGLATTPGRRSGAGRESCANHEGLDRLATDPHPLARLIARAAIAREESRGCPPALGLPGHGPASSRAATSWSGTAPIRCSSTGPKAAQSPRKARI